MGSEENVIVMLAEAVMAKANATTIIADFMFLMDSVNILLFLFIVKMFRLVYSTTFMVLAISTLRKSNFGYSHRPKKYRVWLPAFVRVIVDDVNTLFSLS